MQVLDHEHARAGAQRVQHGREDLVLGRAVPAAAPAPTGPSSSATSRSGPSGRGVLSESHMPHSGCARRLLDEGAQQDGLADARLAGDEDDRAVAGGGAAGAVLEHVEGMVALQQPHADDRKSDIPALPNGLIHANTQVAGPHTQGRTWVRSPVAVCERVRAAGLRL